PWPRAPSSSCPAKTCSRIPRISISPARAAPMGCWNGRPCCACSGPRSAIPAIRLIGISRTDTVAACALSPLGIGRAPRWRPAHACTARKPSVAVVFDLEQGKRTQHVRHVCRRCGGEVRAVEFGESIDAEQAEAALHLVLQQLEKPHHPGLAAG